MSKKIYELAFALHSALEGHEDVLLLKELESKVNEDEEVKSLHAVCNNLQDKINNLLEYYDIEHYEVRSLRQELFAQKYLLDSNPLVIQYNKQYKKVSELYSYVSMKIFDDFCKPRGCSCQ